MNIIQKYIFDNTATCKNKTLNYHGFILMFAERKLN